MPTVPSKILVWWPLLEHVQRLDWIYLHNETCKADTTSGNILFELSNRHKCYDLTPYDGTLVLNNRADPDVSFPRTGLVFSKYHSSCPFSRRRLWNWWMYSIQSVYLVYGRVVCEPKRTRIWYYLGGLRSIWSYISNRAGEAASTIRIRNYSQSCFCDHVCSCGTVSILPPATHSSFKVCILWPLQLSLLIQQDLFVLSIQQHNGGTWIFPSGYFSSLLCSQHWRFGLRLVAYCDPSKSGVGVWQRHYGASGWSISCNHLHYHIDSWKYFIVVLPMGILINHTDSPGLFCRIWFICWMLLCYVVRNNPWGSASRPSCRFDYDLFHYRFWSGCWKRC